MPVQELEFCTVERDGPVTVVTLNRPDVMNALHYDADLELDRVWTDFADDPEQWIGIVTGAGRGFSTGNDLKFQATLKGRRPFPRSGFAGLSTRFDLDKPVIAAVNGAAMGGGVELALSCDLVIADEEAYFSLSEPRVGLAPLVGGVQYLPLTIGLQRAMGILLTGRRVSAREAQDLGFINEVAEHGKALDCARGWADQLRQCSPMALRAIKEAARKTLMPRAFEDSFSTDLPATERLRQSADYKEGSRAFAEKRRPVWKND